MIIQHIALVIAIIISFCIVFTIIDYSLNCTDCVRIKDTEEYQIQRTFCEENGGSFEYQEHPFDYNRCLIIDNNIGEKYLIIWNNGEPYFKVEGEKG